MNKFKKTLYPKTKRVGSDDSNIIVTEKLDGSNLGIFKLNNKLVIAQRNHVFIYPDEKPDYKGLVNWLEENSQHLLDNLHEGSGFFGEWIGMGKIKYGNTLDKKLYMFAKANIDEEYNAYNIYYDRHLFIYPFINQEIPEYLGVVPKVVELTQDPSITELDDYYLLYLAKVGRSVEGFVINTNNTVRKYVRFKNGKLTDHKVGNE